MNRHGARIQARIQFLNGPLAGQVRVLPEGLWAVGRSTDNTVVLPEPMVSARHCELRVHAGVVLVRDAGARNGTFVGGRRAAVGEDCLVNDGQTVRFGPVLVMVRLEPAVRPWFRRDRIRFRSRYGWAIIAVLAWILWLAGLSGRRP